MLEAEFTEIRHGRKRRMICNFPRLSIFSCGIFSIVSGRQLGAQNDLPHSLLRDRKEVQSKPFFAIEIEDAASP